MPETSTTADGRLVGGRYRLVAKLARGGMAEVWEAHDEVLTRPVAVKLLLPHLAADEAFHTRFHREALAAARLSHPHIVSIYDTCSTEDDEAIVMELVRGPTLREVLDRRGALPPARAVAIARQVADALAHAHASGLVHRDVKPGNILLADDGRVLVTDFGIAKAAEQASDLTDHGQVVGTAKYLSPEQVRGAPLDGRADVYGLGVVLYEMLCGRPPFDADSSTATAVARLTTDPIPPRQVRAGVSRELEEVVLRALARDPDARYPTATALCSALDSVDLGALDDDESDHTSYTRTDDPTPAPGSTPSFTQTERSWIVPAALIVVIAITLGVVGIVLGRTDVGRQLFDAATGGDDATAATTVPITEASSFDPEGSRGEHDDELPLAIDGDTSTTWTTERYDTRLLGGLKTGVGLVLTIGEARALEELRVASPTQDWAMQVFVATSPSDSLAGWGEPVATVEGIAGEATVDLDGVEGGAVLLWITDLGDGTVDGFTVAIAEARITAS